MKRKLELCSANCDCKRKERALHCLKQHGIEPRIKTPWDREATLFLFETPANWTIGQLRKLNIDLWKVFENIPARTPCYICYSRDWNDCFSRECDFCGDTIFICRECVDMFSKVDVVPRLCHDCEEQDTIDESIAPHLHVLVWKEIIRSRQGMTLEAIKNKIGTMCAFDKDADKEIEKALETCLKQETILQRNKTYVVNKGSH